MSAAFATGSLAAIFGTSGTTLLPEERRFFADADPFGFILFARNVETPQQLRRLTGDLRDAVGRDAPILVDQEGGRVQRLRAPYWREWLPPLDMVRQASDPLRAMWIRYRLIAHELRGVGIDSNCAPCADVARDETHPFLKNRCYGFDPETVSAVSDAVSDAMLAGGVLPVAKHMPGHGRAVADSHKDLPHVSAEAPALYGTDFAAFKGLADLPMAMTAHIVFSAIDPDRPATQSPHMVDLIRSEIGFNGLLMTDDLGMEALSGSLAQRTAKSIEAGCDLALHCKGDMAEMIAVAGACGAQGETTIGRASRALGMRHAPEPVDIEALEAELRHLMARGGPTATAEVNV